MSSFKRTFAQSKTLVGAALFAGLLTTASVAQADDAMAAKTIASDEANGMTVRALANAVAEIQHSATADGKAAMETIVASDMAGAQEKALAEIVLGINHVPSAEAKASLQAML